MSNSIFLQRMTAMFEIVQVFLLSIISHCYATLCKPAKLPPGKQILLQKFEFFLYQTSIPLANVNMVMTPPPPLLTLVNISETPPSPLSVNVIYTRPKLFILVGLQQRKREGNSNFSIFSILKGY